MFSTHEGKSCLAKILNKYSKDFVDDQKPTQKDIDNLEEMFLLWTNPKFNF